MIFVSEVYELLTKIDDILDNAMSKMGWLHSTYFNMLLILLKAAS